MYWVSHCTKQINTPSQGRPDECWMPLNNRGIELGVFDRGMFLPTLILFLILVVINMDSRQHKDQFSDFFNLLYKPHLSCCAVWNKWQSARTASVQDTMTNCCYHFHIIKKFNYKTKTNNTLAQVKTCYSVTSSSIIVQKLLHLVTCSLIYMIFT